MHIPSFALFLSLIPSLVTAADKQVPLNEKVAGWFDKAKEYVPTGISNPVDAAAAAVSDGFVEKVNIRNFQRKLQPKVGHEEEWMVFLTGGNKTCFGRCEHAETVWNASVPLLKALPKTHDLKIGYVNCEQEQVLCAAWAAAVPAVYHFIFPPKSTDPSTSTPASPMRPILLEIYNCTTDEIVSIPRAGKSRYLDYEPYTGILHPVDSILAKLGLSVPLGYVIWGFGTTPSWLIMIGISFMSRQVMSRRMNNRPSMFPAGQAPGAPAAAAAAPARPAAAGAPGTAKKRK